MFFQLSWKCLIIGELFQCKPDLGFRLHLCHSTLFKMWCKIVNEDNTLKVSFCGFQVQLYIYFMLKFAMEILLSESSVVTANYFQWGTRSVSLFLALLGLTVLPVNWIVGSYASNLFQDRYFYNLQIISSYANNDGNFKYVIDGSLMYLHCVQHEY